MVATAAAFTLATLRAGVAKMLYLLVLTKKFGGSCLHLQGINGDRAVDEHTL